MSLGNWEGKTSDEAEPEELPDFDAFLYLYGEERFILFQGQKLLNKCRNNMGNGCG